MTAYDQLIDTLGDRVSRSNGTTASARCPGHDDHSPSLSITATEGQVLVYCHAGCRTDDVLAALGMRTADLFDDPRGIDYRYDNGRTVHRYPDKRFRQDGTNNPPQLYHLGKVRDAVSAGRPVFVVEGEKDVHALEALGITATCSPMGAGKWDKVDPSPLYGADVRIIADQDEPGRKHARDVLASLQGKAAKAAIFRPADRCHDAADHVAADHEVKDFVPAEEPEPGSRLEIATGNPFPDEPIPLTGSQPLPAFPTDALPTVLERMVTALAESTQTDPAMPGTSILSVLAATVGGRAEIEIRAGWREGLNLYTVTVAGPGERKSAVQAEVTRPLRDQEANLANESAAARREAETMRHIADKSAEQAKAAAAKAEGADKDRLQAEAIGLAQMAEAITVPAVPRILADDITGEATASLLCEQGGRLGIISAEGGIFEVIAGRYSSNIPQMDVWLKGHSGDPIRVDRKGRAPEYIPRPALTVGLMIQPDVLTTIGRNGAFRGRGLLARFLYALPVSKVGHRRAGAASVPDEIASKYTTLIATLARDFHAWTDPAILRLDPHTAAGVIALEEAVEPQLADNGDLASLADWGAKLVGAIVRIAGLLHLAEHGEPGHRIPVALDTLQRAQRIGSYYKRHAIVAFERMRVDQTIDDARYLLAVLGRLGQPTVSRREIFTAASRGRFKQAADLDPAIKVLLDHGWLAEIPVETPTGRGRPPSPRWHVHPAALIAETAKTSR
jgi:hypothetical protein